MLVSGVLFVLFDIVILMFVVGIAVRLVIPRRKQRTATWPTTTRSVRSHFMPSHTYAPAPADQAAAEAALARHPASRLRNASAGGRTFPKGPDDDPEFLRALSQRIRQMRGENPD